MSIFITGIAGFIGFHVAEALRKRGHAVVGCDNFNNYYDPQLKRDRAALLPGVKIVDADIRSTSLLDQLLRENGVTHFVHLAAQAGVRFPHPESYVSNNLEGFVSVLEALRRHPHIPLTYASSSSVYGLNTKIPFSEDDTTDIPSSLYGATKKSNELIAHSYHHLYGLSTTGLRFFTVYGPWGRPDMAYFSFATSILQGKPLQLFNHGKMQRDFTYIDDIVSGILAAIDLAAPHAIFNLGNHQPEEVLRLVELLEKNLKKSALKEFVGPRVGEIQTTFADIKKSREALGFSPKVSLEEGIQRFVDWYRYYYKIS